MSNKEIQEFNEKLRRGLDIAEKRMLQEKALRGQDVVVCGSDQINCFFDTQVFLCIKNPFHPTILDLD